VTRRSYQAKQSGRKLHERGRPRVIDCFGPRIFFLEFALRLTRANRISPIFWRSVKQKCIATICSSGHQSDMAAPRATEMGLGADGSRLLTSVLLPGPSPRPDTSRNPTRPIGPRRIDVL